LKTLAAALLAVLAGCAAAPQEPPAAAAPPPCCPCACPPAATVPAPAPAASSPATTATRAYRQTEKTIAPAVTAPDASAAYIRAVDRADRLAREALRLLVSQDGHPTAEAIARAKQTMDDLIATLDAP